MAASSLPIDLRRLANHLSICAERGLGMSADECGRVAVLLHLAKREADALVARAELMPELEDELLAVAHDLDRAGPVPASGYQAALKAQQAEIQRELDRGEPVHVSRPGLAALAMPIGDTNVVTFPVAARPRGPFDGDDGLDGGDAV